MNMGEHVPWALVPMVLLIFQSPTISRQWVDVVSGVLRGSGEAREGGRHESAEWMGRLEMAVVVVAV